MLAGFLVVLAEARNRRTGRPYSGVARVPTYPTEVPGEESAMDEYVFGGLKDPDTNVISSLNAAVRLCKVLGRAGRRYEIIYCRDADQPIAGFGEEIDSAEHLGYDVATVRTECWSIVEDFAHSDWAKPYRRRLNRNGLFAERADAEAYLREYRAHSEPDADFPFDVVEVIKIGPRERQLSTEECRREPRVRRCLRSFFTRCF
jgi:hypothetical protein